MTRTCSSPDVLHPVAASRQPAYSPPPSPPYPPSVDPLLPKTPEFDFLGGEVCGSARAGSSALDTELHRLHRTVERLQARAQRSLDIRVPLPMPEPSGSPPERSENDGGAAGNAAAAPTAPQAADGGDAAAAPAASASLVSRVPSGVGGAHASSASLVAPVASGLGVSHASASLVAPVASGLGVTPSADVNFMYGQTHWQQFTEQSDLLRLNSKGK